MNNETTCDMKMEMLKKSSSPSAPTTETPHRTGAGEASQNAQLAAKSKASESGVAHR